MANEAGRKKRAPTVWVLDTETKGTGAEMIPLEKAQRRKSSQPPRDRIRVIRRPSGSREEPVVDELDSRSSEQVRPRRFKLVNVLKRQVVAEDADAREIVEALEGVPSIADVHIYVRQDAEEPWRPLSFAERQAFWGYRSTD